MEGPFHLSRLGPEDTSAYRELRLLALRLHPDAFGASYEEESALSDSDFAERLVTGAVFGAWLEGRLIGCAGLAQREKISFVTKPYSGGCS